MVKYSKSTKSKLSLRNDHNFLFSLSNINNHVSLNYAHVYILKKIIISNNDFIKVLTPVVNHDYSRKLICVLEFKVVSMVLILKESQTRLEFASFHIESWF